MLIYPQKVIICPQSVPFFPRIDHLTTFISLSKMIFALLSKNVAIRIYALLLAKFARMSGIGGGGGEGGGSQPNFGNARILGTIWLPSPP